MINRSSRLIDCLMGHMAPLQSRLKIRQSGWRTLLNEPRTLRRQPRMLRYQPGGAAPLSLTATVAALSLTAGEAGLGFLNRSSQSFSESCAANTATTPTHTKER